MTYLEKLQSPDIQEFIQQNWQKNPHDLMLQRDKLKHLPLPEIAEQIHCLQKAQIKLPTWFATPHLIYTKTAIEQCSSEITAQFKAQLLQNQKVVDLTGGLGVDTYFFACQNPRVTHVEPNIELQNIVRYNYKLLKINNLDFFAGTATDYLSQATEVDAFYLDPSRRTEQQRNFRLEDGEPNILGLLPQLLAQASQVWLKTSPFLDISLTIRQLAQVHKVWVLSVANEVKEVLYCLQNHSQEPDIQAINFKNNGQSDSFDFRYSEEKKLAETQTIPLASPQKYLYEPNAAILKAGAFLSFAHRFNLAKLHPNSHLYTANALIKDIPARVFSLKALTKLDKKSIYQHLPNRQANLTVRNFPLTVAQIRQKIQLKEGGDDYLFATTDFNNQHLILICEQL
ncbi:MAG: class I SAM-dependent methyltransferase [Microscillaceae bacterium]|jgi:hypothetical protein|nr:class I SAM-dependent methyltransferase [Microscillaceae bacterium]